MIYYINRTPFIFEDQARKELFSIISKLAADKSLSRVELKIMQDLLCYLKLGRYIQVERPQHKMNVDFMEIHARSTDNIERLISNETLTYDQRTTLMAAATLLIAISNFISTLVNDGLSEMDIESLSGQLGK